MKKQNKNITDAEILRQKAVEKLKISKDKALVVPKTEADMLKLIHELEVHQIELEMQNIELVAAKEKAELAKQKYIELYDFAPSGYLTLSKEGEISELNFVAAQMLGKERLHLIKKRFSLFVSRDTRITFNLFFDGIFTSKEKQSCELIIATEGNLPIYVNIEGVLSQNNELCLLTLVDITKRKQLEEELSEHRDYLEELVKERTKKIETKNKDLEHYNELFINREFRIKELRDEVADLKKSLDI